MDWVGRAVIGQAAVGEAVGAMRKTPTLTLQHWFCWGKVRQYLDTYLTTNGDTKKMHICA